MHVVVPDVVVLQVVIEVEVVAQDVEVDEVQVDVLETLMYVAHCVVVVPLTIEIVSHVVCVDVV